MASSSNESWTAGCGGILWRVPGEVVSCCCSGDTSVVSRPSPAPQIVGGPSSTQHRLNMWTWRREHGGAASADCWHERRGLWIRPRCVWKSSFFSLWASTRLRATPTTRLVMERLIFILSWTSECVQTVCVSGRRDEGVEYWSGIWAETVRTRSSPCMALFSFVLQLLRCRLDTLSVFCPQGWRYK